MNFVAEFAHTWMNRNYLGPHNSDFTQAPINHLDTLAMLHDTAYSKANRRRGRSSLVAKAQADFAMAGSSDNPIIKLGMYTQGMIRVFTFNSVPLPW